MRTENVRYNASAIIDADTECIQRAIRKVFRSLPTPPASAAAAVSCPPAAQWTMRVQEEEKQSKEHTSERKMIINKQPLTDFYHVGPVIGTGAFAQVRELTRLSDNCRFAGKFQKKRRLARRSGGTAALSHEIHVHAACTGHHRFPALVEVFESGAGGSEVVLVLQYALGGEIYPYCVGDLDEVGGVVFSERDVIRYTRQILQGVLFLHNQLNVVHLDIKPQNLLLSAPYPEGDILIVDFGLSRTLDRPDIQIMAGTPDYNAPEIVNFDPISKATDIWSVGVVVYVMLTGDSPFAGETNDETSSRILNVDLEYPVDQIPQLAIHFLQSIFKRNPKDRPTVEDLLEHPWLNPPADPPACFPSPPVKSASSPSALSWCTTDSEYSSDYSPSTSETEASEHGGEKTEVDSSSADDDSTPVASLTSSISQILEGSHFTGGGPTQKISNSQSTPCFRVPPKTNAPCTIDQFKALSINRKGSTKSKKH